jgi:hypothetical protein
VERAAVVTRFEFRLERAGGGGPCPVEMGEGAVARIQRADPLELRRHQAGD